MWREHLGSTNDPQISFPGRRPAEPRLADRITEDVLQLLYAAGHEIADVRDARPGDEHARLAALRVRESIAALREIAALLRDQEDDLRRSEVALRAGLGGPSVAGGIGAGGYDGLRGPGDGHAEPRVSA